MADTLSIIASFIGGGVSGSLLTLFSNWIIQRRHEAMEVLQIVSKAAPYYNLLAMNAWNFGWNITSEKVEKRNNERIMYYFCNMLYFREEITKKFGDLQFDNLEAEKIIFGFWREIKSLVEEGFGYVDASKLASMVQEHTPYHKFHEGLSNENKELYDKFLIWISKIPQDKLERAMWYAQLIQLELNHIYRLWYGEEPPPVLTEGLKKHLMDNEPHYYNRITSFSFKHLRRHLRRNP